MRRIFIALTFTLLSCQVVSAKNYIVKKGDTLAGVARSYYGEPVFGARGTLKKIYRLNPWTKAVGLKLEPGQSLVLEDLATDKPQSPAAPKKVEIEQEQKVVATTIPDIPKKEPVALPQTEQKTETQHDEKTKEVIEEEKPSEAHVPRPLEHHEAATEHEESHSVKKNEFAALPFYSLVSQTATDAASNISYTLSSNSYGAELGWTHHWSESFSSDISYAYSQISSSATVKSGAKLLDSLSLNQVEFALLNQISNRIKFGLGLAYNDHLFLENFSDPTLSPSIYKATFLNPFLNAEVSAYESESLELLLNLKVGSLPAQNGQGHDLSSGTEFFAELAALQKFEAFSLRYSLSYSTEDQTRVDSRENRSESMFKLGLVF